MRRLSLVVVLGALTLSACSDPVPGVAHASPAGERAAQAETYGRGVAAFEKHFTNLGDEHAKVYNYVKFGDLERRNEFEGFRFGEPEATLLKRSNGRPGFESEILTPKGSEVDYVRLGPKRAHLAPTPWVSVPLQNSLKDDCYFLTTWVACKLHKALKQTDLEAPDRQGRAVTRGGDGYELRTAVLAGEMIANGILAGGGTPREQEMKKDEKITSALVPVTFRFDGDWNFVSFELRARIDTSTDPLELQLGYEVAGKATAKDIPKPPDASEVTAITDKAAADKFWTDYNDAAK